MTAPNHHRTEDLGVSAGVVMFGGNLPDTDLSQLRNDQLSRAGRSTMVQIGALAIAALAIIADNLATQPLWLLGTYGGAVVLTLAIRFNMRDRRRAGWIEGSRSFVAQEFLLGGLTAAVLCAPMLWLAWGGDTAHLTSVWLIVLAAMAVYG